MDKNALQKDRVEALKALNNTIVTSRLYPSEAPQVTVGIERGYKGIKHYLRQYGPLEFSFDEGVAFVCDRPLSQEVIDSFPNLIIFRHLQILGMERLVIGADMDRFAFRQLVKVFNSSVEAIRREGGGRVFVTGLGLASFFPEEVADVDAEMEEADEPKKERRILKIRQELLGCFLGRSGDEDIQSELEKVMQNTDSAVEVLSAAIGHLLLAIRKKKEIYATPSFPGILQKAEAMVPKNRREKLAHALAVFLVDSLQPTALCVLLVQEYPEGFGELLYDAVLSAISLEKLGEIVVIYREQLAEARERHGEWNVQQGCLGKNFLKLLESKKGQQVLHAERAKELIYSGEKERKKKRIEAGLRGLLSGKAEVLRSEELQYYLNEAVLKYMRAEREGEVEKILTTLGVALQGNDGQDTLLDCTLQIGEQLLRLSRLDMIDSFLQPLKENVSAHRSVSKELREGLDFLQRVMQKSWEAGDLDRGDGILYLFHKLRSGELSCALPIQLLAGKIQDSGIVRSSLPRLLAQFLADPEKRQVGYRLVLQGPVAIRFLIESLIHAEDGRDRMLIIDLLTGFTRFLPKVVHERLDEHMPWFGKRNLIKLLGESGAEEDAEKVAHYLGYDDIRVQREAFLCVYKIGGHNKRQLLLKGLEDAGEPVKIQIIAALTASCDQDIATRLVELLETYKYFSDRYRDELLTQILETLGHCTCATAQKGVQNFIALRGTREGRKLTERIWDVAERTLGYLEMELKEAKKQYLHAGQLRKNALKQAAKMTRLRAGEQVITGMPQEQQIRRLLRQSETDAAADLLIKLIERVARQRNFNQAEKLKEWLIEIDPSGLKRIIRAAEIIDDEKFATVDRGHMEIWSELYDLLAEEDFSTLYHAMRHRRYNDGEMIVRQGQVYSCLFFINSGTVKLYFESEKGEVLIRTMGRGEVFGAMSFFEASSWTLSIASVGRSELSLLKQESLKDWQEDHPGLEAKLRDFCQQFETIDVFLKEKSAERRAETRHSVAGRLQTMLLDGKGNYTGISATVELGDISQGGISYLARIARKENVRLLLGRKVQMNLPLPDGEKQSVTGDILAVRSVYVIENDYSVHVRFDKSLTKSQLHQIIGQLKS